MRIIRSVRHKMCADGSFMKELRVSEPITETFVRFLQNFGSVLTLAEMGPGFFKFELKNGFSLKGLIGDTTVEIRYKKEVMDICEDFFSALIYYYHDGDPDLQKLNRMAETVQNKIQKKING